MNTPIFVKQEILNRETSSLELSYVIRSHAHSSRDSISLSKHQVDLLLLSIYETIDLEPPTIDPIPVNTELNNIKFIKQQTYNHLTQERETSYLLVNPNDKYRCSYDLTTEQLSRFLLDIRLTMEYRYSIKKIELTQKGTQS